MSDKKSSYLLKPEDIEYSHFHSDSDSLLEEHHTALLVKSEKKKSITNNFGRPRKHPYKPGKYKCSYCETLCSKPSVLTKHMRAHTNERPFPCSVCERSFKTKSNLSKHEKSKSHSSKLGENYVTTEPNQSNREKADMLLQALSGRNLNAPYTMKSFEFDGPGHKTPMSESGNYSPTSSDDKSMVSDENSIPETVKKEKNLEQIQDNIGDLAEITESSSSCSGVLTINSQGGPITVEVQINLETMRHLQQGLTNMTNKRNSPSSPIQSIMSRNDAELRAAESILQMSNQRLVLPENHFSKDDIRKYGVATRKPPGAQSPLSRKSPDPISLYKPIAIPNFITKSLSPKDKSSVSEESDPLNSRKQKKCLVKENLLKKMQRKQVQEVTCISGTDTTVMGSVCTCHNNKITESTLINSNNFMFNSSLYINKTLIPDSKSTAVLLNPLKPTKGKPGILIQKTQLLPSNSHILNCITTTCNSPTIVLLAQTNTQSRTVACDPKPNSSISIGSFPETSKLNMPLTNCNLDIDTATLSKVITNTQSLHKHQGGNKPSNPDNLSVTNIITTSRVAISSACIDDSKHDIPLSNSIDKSTDVLHQFVKNEHDVDVSEFNPTTYQKQISSHTAQESENESSPRLCIVEDPLNSSAQISNFDKKSSESDEEIDVVNTDSDDDRLSLKRIAEIAYSDDVIKKRRISCDEDSESTQKDIKRIKDVEKCVHLHAPNINAKDLMQDCPLNLSANRQPTIPPVSQIPVSVLQNLYQTISPSSVSISSLTNSSNAFEPDPHINSLTNHNPAHPQSFQNFSSSGTSFSTNGHHHDYPIFEDKISCDVCSQMIEPSMLSLHKNMHIYTNSKDSHPHGGHSTKAGSSATSSDSTYPLNSKIPFNKPRSYKCVVCNIAFRVIGHLRKHHKSKTHLLGLVNSGLLSKALYSKIEQSKVPIPEVIDQKTGNIIPDVLSRYISNWSQPSTDSEPH